MSKIRVAVTEPKGQVKLATDHRPSMARPWISALAFKKKTERKEKKGRRKKRGKRKSDNQGIHTDVQNLILFFIFH